MAQQGYKAKFQYSDTPSPSGAMSWTDFSNIIDIKPPKIEAADIDTSVMDSPDQFETYDPGWAKGGEAEMKIQFDKTQQATVYGLFRTPKGFRIVFNDAPTNGTGSNLTMAGYINKFANEIDRKGLVTADITVKVSGKPDFIPASGA